MKYLVIGLGTYGRELAINLSLQGNEVIGVDHRSENIEAVKEQRQLPAFFYSLPRGSLKTATVA